MTVLVVALLAGVAIVYAEKSFDWTTPEDLGQGVWIRPSTKVSMKLWSDPASYAMTSKHEQGDRCFGGTSEDVKLFWIAAGCEKGTAAPISAGGSDSAAFYSGGWTPL